MNLNQYTSNTLRQKIPVKARLHRRFLSRQLDAIFVALKLQQVSNMFETPAISRRQIALKIAPGLHVRFWSCILGATKIASNCRDKNRLCIRALRYHYKLNSNAKIDCKILLQVKEWISL